MREGTEENTPMLLPSLTKNNQVGCLPRNESSAFKKERRNGGAGIPHTLSLSLFPSRELPAATATAVIPLQTPRLQQLLMRFPLQIARIPALSPLRRRATARRYTVPRRFRRGGC